MLVLKISCMHSFLELTFLRGVEGTDSWEGVATGGGGGGGREAGFIGDSPGS